MYLEAYFKFCFVPPIKGPEVDFTDTIFPSEIDPLPTALVSGYVLRLSPSNYRQDSEIVVLNNHPLSIQAYLGHCVTPSNYGPLPQADLARIRVHSIASPRQSNFARIDGATYYPWLAWPGWIRPQSGDNITLQ
jgi:hypothetical protein